MADTAFETDFVRRPAYPEMSAKPKIKRAPAPSSRAAKPATIATIGARKQKPIDQMEMARRSRLTVAGMAR